MLLMGSGPNLDILVFTFFCVSVMPCRLQVVLDSPLLNLLNPLGGKELAESGDTLTLLRFI